MKRYLFYLNLTALMLGIAGIFGATGLLAYRTLTEITNSIRDQGKPDLKLATIKEIAAELDKTENNIKLYRLTRDEQYVQPYRSILTDADQKMSSLYGLYSHQTEQIIQLDSISSLLQDKFLIWGKLINLKENSGAANVLGKLSRKFISSNTTDTFFVVDVVEIAQPTVDTTLIEPTSAEETSFWKKLFTRKKNQAEEKITENTSETNEVSVTTKKTPAEKKINPKELKAEINRLELEDSLIKKHQVEQELFLLKRNNEVTLNINNIITRLEKEEMAEIARRAIKADAMANRTSQWILFFSIGISLLLLSVFIVITRYITKWMAYQRALQKTTAEAENLAHTKEQFLANMSHELRTPMNAISGFAEQLSQEPLTAKGHDKVNIIRKSALHLVKLITEILDFSKLEAGRMIIEEEPFNLESVFHEIEQIMQHEASKKNLHLKYYIDNSVPKVLSGDPFRLKQMLLNLVSNAIKFTKSGSIEIMAHCSTNTAGQLITTISVKDTGIGITNDKLNSIFDDFIQAESSTSKNYGGTGLGLSIVKKLAELQNGSVEVTSLLGKGSSFSIILPYKPLPDEHLPLEPKAFLPNLSKIKGMNVLIADDTDFNRVIITETLRKWEISFEEASNGFEAVEKAIQKPYDLILMDLRMPGMDGLSATLHLRKAKSKHQIAPIIAITAGISASEKDKCLNAGISEFLIKPFTEENLYLTLIRYKQLENIVPKNQSSMENNKALNNIENSGSRINIQQLEKIADGNEAFVREMLDMFLKTAGEGVGGIKQSIAEKNWLAAAEYAHKISSPCRLLEINLMLQLLGKIEHAGRNNFDLDKIEIWSDTIENELFEVCIEVDEYLKVQVS